VFALPGLTRERRNLRPTPWMFDSSGSVEGIMVDVLAAKRNHKKRKSAGELAHLLRIVKGWRWGRKNESRVQPTQLQRTWQHVKRVLRRHVFRPAWTHHIHGTVNRHYLCDSSNLDGPQSHEESFEAPALVCL